MMSSRGDSPAHVTALAQLTAALAPTQASTVAAVCDLFAMLQEAGPLLAAAVKDFRAAEEAAKDAAAGLSKAADDHAAQMAALAASTEAVQWAASAVTEREGVCQKWEAEITRKQGTFDVQQTELAARKYELDQREKRIADADAALEIAKANNADDQAAKSKALNEEIDRKSRESEAAIQTSRDKAAYDIREWRAVAQAEIAVQQEEMRTREAELIGREEALQRERARLSALLQE